MIELALKARLPLIAVHTTDLVNLPTVLEFLAGGRKPEVLGNPSALSGDDKLYFVVADKVDKSEPFGKSNRKLYDDLSTRDSSVVLVNASKIPYDFYDAGEMPVPKGLIVQIMAKSGMSKAKIDEILPGLGGLTIKEISEVVSLCQARYHSVSVMGITKIRKETMPAARGLVLVDTEMSYHFPNQTLDARLHGLEKFLLGDYDWRLRPRGCLLYGTPGTGKTVGAKYIATKMGLPLYRLDVGAVKGKYVGESEHALKYALAKADREEPSILLIDEVEKLFRASHDQGTTTNLLAELLWWLAEHKSRLFTVMTSNDVKAIPPELHREGRIDFDLEMKGLSEKEGRLFMEGLIKSFGQDVDSWKDSLRSLQEIFWPPGEATVPHSRVAEVVKDVLRKRLMEEES